MKAEKILAIANFLGDEMTDDQASRLMDEVRQLGVGDKQWLMDHLEGGPLYTDLTMHDGEMGWLGRY